MILKLDKLLIQLPLPDEPDPDGAAAVQELLGGRFGEMSTFMNYTYQSFNLRGRDAAKPYFDLISTIRRGGVRLYRARLDCDRRDAHRDER